MAVENADAFFSRPNASMAAWVAVFAIPRAARKRVSLSISVKRQNSPSLSLSMRPPYL
jgi:hypothetical protein